MVEVTPKADEGTNVQKPVAPMADGDPGFPKGSADEAEELLQFLGYLRRGVLRKFHGLSDEEARWTPEGKLTSLLGIVNHLTGVEWRWVDGGFLGVEVAQGDAEFQPGPELTAEDAAARYRERAAKTDDLVRSLPLSTVGSGWAQGHTLRFVVLHLIDETARHAGHADATREMLDGLIGL